MDREIFTEWLADLNEKMAHQHRHILLLIDNFKGHFTNNLRKLSHIEVLFLPPNFTSVVQALDQGIIASLKRIYKKNLLYYYWAQIKSGQEVTEVNMHQAIRYLVQSWNDVKQSTIVNCFRKALPDVYVKSTEVESEPDTDLEDEILDEFFSSSYTFDDYVEADQNVVTSSLLGQTIVKEGINDDTIVQDDVDGELDEDQADNEPLQVVRPKEALQAANILLLYCSQCEFGTQEEHTFLSKLSQKISKEVDFKKKQASITDYFKTT